VCPPKNRPQNKVRFQVLNLEDLEESNNRKQEFNNKTGNKQTDTELLNVLKKRLNCNHPILAWVKYPCYYRTDNCKPVGLNVNYEKSNVLMRASLPSQRAHKKPFEKSIKALISINASYLTCQCITSLLPKLQ
jgi:hypothetical protein